MKYTYLDVCTTFFEQVSSLFALKCGSSRPHQSQAVPGQAGAPVILTGQDLSQCFLSDCSALRFHLWSKLCLPVPDCHTNPPPAPSPAPCHDSPDSGTWEERQRACTRRGRGTADNPPQFRRGSITGFKKKQA